MSKYDNRLNVVENQIIKIENDISWIKRMSMAILALLAGRTVVEVAPIINSFLRLLW